MPAIAITIANKPLKAVYWMAYMGEDEAVKKKAHYGCTDPGLFTVTGQKYTKAFEKEADWTTCLKDEFKIDPDVELSDFILDIK